ncbi:unnamed protein product [Bursaphelenchus xylophilus]|uniref:DNA-directed DNA polymerase n=1 Tax=Bursaphelenchus xylophilus TaxID=6326 RepID=A0A811KF50_BURXY|nr:unnamed protein product [Bursaphelenchus xylophilus]CAG9093814.1 unnamed protein product [Bursaphelenchus xylophilus]
MKRPSNEPNHQPSKSRRIDLNKVEQFLLEASSSLLDLPTISEDWHAIPFELEESELYLDGETDSESDESETNIINGVLEYLEEKGASEIRASEGLLQYFKGRADFEKFLQDYLTDIGDFVNCFEDTNTYDARFECLVLQDQKQDYEGGLKTSEGLLNYLKGRTDFEQFLQEYLTDVGDFATTFVEKTSADDARSVCIVHQDQKQDYDRGWRFYVPEMLHEVLYLPWSFDEPENSEIKKDGHARGKPESKLKAMKARIEMEYKWKEELEGSEDVEVEMENSDWILENDLAMSDTEVEEEMDEDILAKDLALSETESEPDKNEEINYREVLMKELELSDSDDESELDTEDSENNSNSGYDDAYDADTSDPEELSNQVGGGNGLTLIAKNFVQNETFPELRLAVSYKMSEASQIDNLEYTFRRIINQMFEDMASEVQRTKPGRDIMRINLSLQGGLLGKTVYTGMQNVANFSPDLLFTALSKVQQSHRQVNLLGRPFEILMTAYLSRDLRNGDRTGGIRGGHRTDGATGYNQETGVFQYRERRRLCLPLAILICKLYHGTERYGNKSRTAHQMCNTNSRIFKESVAKTLKDLGLPLDPAHDLEMEPTVRLLQSYLDKEDASNAPHVIVIHGTRNFKDPHIFTSGNLREAKTILPIAYDAIHNHFEAIVTSSNYFGGRKMCYQCNCTYDRDALHSARCIQKCGNCGRKGPEYPCKGSLETLVYCSSCSTYFQTTECFEEHCKKMCTRYATCQECKSKYRKRIGHTCGTKYCIPCRRKRPIGHRCFIPRIDIPDQEPEYKMVIYDFECTQTEVVADDIRKHNVNMACCQVMCQKCMTDGAWKMGQCENCGSEKKFWSIPHGNSENPARSFYDYVKSITEPSKTTICIAHNSGRYDLHLIIKHILAENQSRVPTIITNGERIYDLTLSGGKEFGCLHFRDSINHLNCALSELPSIYPLEEGESGIKKKGDFPHEFNREENYEYVGPYPSLKEYMVEEMMPKKREKLEEWYRTTDKKIFDFKQELLAYCESDVKILAHAVCEHRKAMRELKGKEFEDIWYHSITLASAVMRDYRQSYLPENTLVIQNESKFGNQINQSAVALKFLRYLKKNFLPSLQFRDSPEGEKKLELLIGGKRKKFSADGFVKEGNLVVEFNGCYYHGCPTCNKDPLKIMGSRKTQKASFKDSTERTKALENAGYVVITFWEHEINEELKINKEMDDFFKNELENAGPAHPRDAFFGGRTASLCLYFKKEGNYVMGYLDVNSLYPFILFMVPMPVGEPRIVALNQDCNWTCPEDMGFEKGLYKVFIIPPDDLFIPVIPLKIEKSILYTLCQKCAKKFANSNFVSYEEATCKHSDLERGWSCTLAHIELEEALRNGYRVIRIYEKIVFDEFSENLFKEPIRKFYREKMLASEIPNYLKTSADFDQFLKAYKDGFGIELEVEDWKPNKAKRYNNKIFLNSFWGKFCQRSSLAKLNFCRNEEDYHTIMSNETLEVQRTVILNSNTCAIHVKTKEDFLEDLEFNNIYIAIYTTAAARLHLFRQMKKATEGGAKILYLDTG